MKQKKYFRNVLHEKMLYDNPNYYGLYYSINHLFHIPETKLEKIENKILSKRKNN